MLSTTQVAKTSTNPVCVATLSPDDGENRRSYGSVYVLCAIGMFIATPHAARHFFVGLSEDYFWVGRAVWWPPLGAGAVAALMLLGAAAMALLGVRRD